MIFKQGAGKVKLVGGKTLWCGQNECERHRTSGRLLRILVTRGRRRLGEKPQQSQLPFESSGRVRRFQWTRPPLPFPAIAGTWPGSRQ